MTSSRNNNAVNMDLEEGLTAASPPSTINHSSAPSDVDGTSIGNHHAPTSTTVVQPGAAPELAAATATATAPSAVTDATNNVFTGPELVDDASGLPLPMGMVEAGLASEEGSTANSINNNSGTSSIVLKVQRFKEEMRRRQIELEALQDRLSLPAASTGSPPAMGLAATNATAAPPSGLELVDESVGLPVPIGMNEMGDHNKGDKSGGVEIIEDGVGPADPLSASELAASLEMSDKTNLVNSPSVPFNPSTLEDVDTHEQKKSSMPSDVDSIVVPSSEENEDLHIITRVDTRRGNRGRDEQTTPVNNQMNTENNRLAEESTVDTGGANDAVAGNDLEQNNTVEPGLGEDRETQIITEAYPVEERSDDGIDIVGQPLLPWWKQRKAKLSFAAVIALFVIFAVSLGVPLSLKAPATVVFNTGPPSESPTEKPSDAPSITTSPSYDHSNPPSASLVPTTVLSTKPSFTPSYSPSACVNQLSSNAQKIDLPIDDPWYPSIAVDGKDMVVVAQQWDWRGPVLRGPVFVIFYTLTNGGWQRVKTFQEDREDSLDEHNSVALSGNTAFVGFADANDLAGAVSVYKKDQYGDWILMEDPLVHDATATHFVFGIYVDIDGDLACVVEYDGTYLYHQENNKWVQFDWIVGGSRCSVAGDIIATREWDSELGFHLQLYKYNQELDRVFSIQDPIPVVDIVSLDLSSDYLVYWDSEEEGGFLYRREEINQTYTFMQQLNISGLQDNFPVIDNDILVVRGNDKTHIFFEQNDGKWEETVTLDQSYWRYALSGRSLFATTGWPDGEVYYFDIAGCSQAMPTQTPSLSTSPTDSPSSSPSVIPSSTLSPSSFSSSPSMSPSSSPTTAPSSSSSPSMIPSSSPTAAPSSSSSPTDTCFWVEVSITYDRWPTSTSWKLERVVDDGGDNDLVKSHRGSEGDTSFVESICLQEGEYIFTIYDRGYNGICCESGEGNYNVTSNSMLIVKGGDFGWREETTFSIPLVPSS